MDTWVVLLFGYYESRCYEHLCTCSCVDLYFHLYLGVELLDYMATQYIQILCLTLSIFLACNQYKKLMKYEISEVCFGTKLQNLMHFTLTAHLSLG